MHSSTARPVAAPAWAAFSGKASESCCAAGAPIQSGSAVVRGLARSLGAANLIGTVISSRDGLVPARPFRSALNSGVNDLAALAKPMPIGASLWVSQFFRPPSLFTSHSSETSPARSRPAG